jgi:hypothetical protein
MGFAIGPAEAIRTIKWTGRLRSPKIPSHTPHRRVHRKGNEMDVIDLTDEVEVIILGDEAA